MVYWLVRRSGAAKAAGFPTVQVATCSELEEWRYLDERARPLLGPDADWLGQADSEHKQDLLARARCLLFPIQWNDQIASGAASPPGRRYTPRPLAHQRSGCQSAACRRWFLDSRLVSLRRLWSG
jgi:hypothetical protein